MKEWKADEQERVGECAEDEIGKGENENEGTAELNGEWTMEDGSVKNDERTRKNSGSHSNKGMQMELKIGKKAATAPRHATARAGWWARPLHLPLSLRLPRQRTGPVRWMRSAG